MTVLRTLLLLFFAAALCACSPTAPVEKIPASTPSAPTVGEAPSADDRAAPDPRTSRPKAAPIVSPRVHLIRTSGSATGPIPYLTVEPADATDQTPIVIALHGRGARADSFARLTEGLRLPLRFIVGRGPLPWGATGGRQWFGAKKSAPFDGITTRVEELGTLVEQLQERYPGSPKPILLGFSQGAMLAMQAVAATPERFGGVVALSGSLPLPDAGARALAPVPALLTAGSFDTIVTPASTDAAAARLKELGHAPEVIHFKGAHSIARELIPRIRSFLTDPG